MNFRILLASSALALIVTGPVLAQPESVNVITTKDVDGGTTTSTTTQAPDGSTTTRTTTTRYYYDGDQNNNGILDSQEFPKFVYRRWDKNGDGFLTNDEWDVSTVRWYKPGETQYKSYTTWDKNGDSRLDSTEFDQMMVDSKLYSSWDVNANNVIEGDEYATATFRMYDTDGDGELNLEEWKAAQ